MKLIPLKEFSKTEFAPGHAPCARTLRTWIDVGAVPGRVIDTGARKQYFVDLDAWRKDPMTGNVLADRILGSN